jgi:sorting nexin-1/2
MLTEGHHEYLIQGSDYKGPYDVYVRFREFHAFHKYIALNWPGIFIPPVPRKKLFVPSFRSL